MQCNKKRVDLLYLHINRKGCDNSTVKLVVKATRHALASGFPAHASIRYHLLIIEHIATVSSFCGLSPPGVVFAVLLALPFRFH